MYSAGQDTGDTGLPRLGLSLGGRQAFDGTASGIRDGLLESYLTDMLSQYGLVLRDDVDLQNSGHSYGQMGGSLIPSVLPSAGPPGALTEAEPGQQPVDLLIFAFAVPDLAPGRSTAAYLARLCPGDPLAFTICDQGVAAPYTALRLLGAYGGTADCRRAALLVAEQATAFYDPPAQAELPTRNAAVLLVFEDRGDGGAAGFGPVRQLRGVGPAAVADAVGAVVAELAAGQGDVTLITGNGLDSHPLPPLAAGRHVAAPSGQPCTGAWWQLVGELRSPAATGQRVLIADYDAALEYVCVAAIDLPA